MSDFQEKGAGPLERYLAVLELVASFPGELTATELGNALGLPKATSHRLIRSLQAAGMIEGADGKNRLVSIGPRLLRLLYAAEGIDRLQAIVRPALQSGAEMIPEGSIYLARFTGRRSMVVASASQDPRWSAYVVPGQMLPPNAAATAMIMLAHQDDDVIDKVISEPFVRYTPHTEMNKTAVRENIRQARDAGYAICIEGIDEGLGAIAVPIALPKVGVVFSVGLTGPIVARIAREPKELVEILGTIANEIALLLDIAMRRIELEP